MLRRWSRHSSGSTGTSAARTASTLFITKRRKLKFLFEEPDQTNPRVCCSSALRTLRINLFCVYLKVDKSCLQWMHCLDFGRFKMTGLTSDIRCSSVVFVRQSRFGWSEWWKIQKNILNRPLLTRQSHHLTSLDNCFILRDFLLAFFRRQHQRCFHYFQILRFTNVSQFVELQLKSKDFNFHIW